MYMPVAGPQSWSRRREVCAPLSFVTRALLSRPAWERACPWLQIEVFGARGEPCGARLLRIAGVAASPVIRLPLRLVLRLQPCAGGVLLHGEGEVVRGSRFHLDGEITAGARGCTLEGTASIDALPSVLRPLVSAVEHRAIARAAGAVESLFRGTQRAA